MSRLTRHSVGASRTFGRHRKIGGRGIARSVDRDHRNEQALINYRQSHSITGDLLLPQDEHAPVQFRRSAPLGRQVVLSLLVAFSATAGVVFIVWLIQPDHVPTRGPVWVRVLGGLAFMMVLAVESVRVLQGLATWVFGLNAKDPIPMVPQRDLRVAFLTTIVPSKEPLEIAEATLKAMKRARHEGQVDVWILDEGDDGRVKRMCERLDVHHFTRKGRPEFNTLSGPFRAKTKSGNHNSWRAEHEHEYDVVAQLDPDHVPLDTFFERTLGYFRDPDVGFVVAPQVYGNVYDGLVAQGSSEQQYLFSSLIERGGNGLEAPILIGTNHLYRPTCWSQIGGYQDSIIEDHLTSMHVQATTNPATGNKWKGIYTPDILAIGEGPTSWADYFNQQKRWAYGIWEILLRGMRPRGMSRRQRLAYSLIQFYYPSVCVTWLLGHIATSLYLVLGVASMTINGWTWALLWGLSVGSWFVMWFFLRRFNLAEHERRDWGFAAMVITLFAGPVYVVAGLSAITRQKLAYAVTAKGALRTVEKLSTFRPHLIFAGLSLIALATSFVLDHDVVWLRFWACLTLFIGLTPPLIAWWSSVSLARAETAAVGEAPSNAGRPRAMPTAAPFDATRRARTARRRPLAPTFRRLGAPTEEEGAA
jgi:cellulose synthase/poly-beta-1,6-N-acetylglucosamine synthase-like glycosyltransferase